MAIAEYDHYIAHQEALAVSVSQLIHAGSASSREEDNGNTAVPAVDYFTGELPEGIASSSLEGQTVAASVAERVTSECGSDGLDPISRATILHRQGSLPCFPCSDVNLLPNPCEDRASTSEVSAAFAECEAYANSKATDINGKLWPLPVRNYRSLSSDSVTGTSSYAMQSLGLQSNGSHSDFDNCSASKVTESATATQNNEIRTLPENDAVQESREVSISGFENHEVVTVTISEERQEHDASSHCNNLNGHLPLHISEAGVNAMKCLAGTQNVPLFPEYSSFLARIQSFHNRFVFGEDVHVNKYILALVGFFYSGYKTITCFHCGCSPRVWGDGREPVTEHRMLSPYCKAIADNFR